MNFSYASDGNGGEIGADMKVNIRGAGTSVTVPMHLR